MKEYIGEIIIGILFVIAITLLISIAHKPVPTRVQIVAHATTSDGHGRVQFNNLIKLPDGRIPNIESEELYVLPLFSYTTIIY